MRLWVFSDLHLEQGDWDLPEQRPEYDVMVAAGDIHRATRAVRWLAERAGDKPVIYVCGNHEWYAPRERYTVEEELEEGRYLARTLGVDLLDDEELTLGDVRFLGTTLWTDFELYRAPARSMHAALRGLNDYRIIFTDGGERLQPSQTRDWHLRSRGWLAERLQERRPEVRKTVVVSHHLPHPRSVAREFEGHPLTPAFCSDLSTMVESGGVDIWVHGHTHASCDYVAGGCRVLCNPKGYGPAVAGGMIENAAFDPGWVIEI